jgi:uncharacterized membrane protein
MAQEKTFERDRLVFFCDAIVAIAITLLAFNLKIDKAAAGHLTFDDLANNWQKFVAFLLSFFSIALFWKIHHRIFSHIKLINNLLAWYNIFWLLFIVLLPFSTSLISAHFFDTAAMAFYCLNTLLITVFQMIIWNYASLSKPEFINDTLEAKNRYDYRISFRVALLFCAIASVISFVNPPVAFSVLILRLPGVLLSHLFFRFSSH